MAWLRYILYFAGVALLMWMLTQLEISFPGSLKLHVFVSEIDRYGTSEYSPVEVIQPLILGICGLLLLWVTQHCPSQRPIAVPFGGLALIFLIRELDYFLDRLFVVNLWQALVAIVGALIIAYSYRHARRFRIAWGRIWPSPGLTLLFAGALILFAFVRHVGQESLWMSILGDDYHRVVERAAEEFIELIGYLMWLLGSIEYTYQARVIAMREPQPAAMRRRQRRLPDSKGRY
jgi:hypothetical protein